MLLFEFFHALFVGVFGYFSKMLDTAVGGLLNDVLGLG
jgi:hypothetical protein